MMPFILPRQRKFKRMHLAQCIKRLYILTYGCKNFVNDEGNDLSSFEPSIAHSEWNKSFIHDRTKLSKLICSSYCGLALSKKEGAMWSCVQYWLCGVPLVSTPSKGGRDYFYDNCYVILVDDNPDAVSAGVNLAIDKNYNPLEIRKTILKKMVAHRYQYLDFIIDNFLKQKILIEKRCITAFGEGILE